MRSLVVSGAGIDDQLVFNNLENETVGFVDVNTPPSGKISAEWFRLTNAVVAVTVDALEKCVDFLEHSSVATLPVGIFRPCAVVP